MDWARILAYVTGRWIRSSRPMQWLGLTISPSILARADEVIE